MLFQLPNPIPWTVKDTEDLTDYFTKHGIIPQYAEDETTAYAFLDLLCTMAELSGTFLACRRDLAAYTFGRNIDIVTKKSIPGLYSEEESTALPFDQKANYANYLSSIGLPLLSILKLSKRLDSHLDINGNAFLKIKRVRVGGTVKFFFSVPHFKHCAYLLSFDRNNEFVINSKFITDKEKLIKYPPLIARVTNQGEKLKWTKTGRGVDFAIIHLMRKSEVNESDYYERSPLIPILTWMYIDFQIGNLNSKIAASEVISKKLLAFQAPDPNTLPSGVPLLGQQQELSGNDIIGVSKEKDSFKENIKVLKKLISNLGDHPSNLGNTAASSIAAVEYPYGGNAPTSIDLEMNRDTKHQDWQASKASAMICAELGWSPELLQIRQAKSNIGGNVLADIFTIKNEATILPRQAEFENFWNELIGQLLMEVNGPAEFIPYGIKFPDVISSIVNKVKSSSSGVGKAVHDIVGEKSQTENEEEDE